MSPLAKFLIIICIGTLVGVAIEVIDTLRQREWRVEYHYDDEETWFYTEHVYGRQQPAQRHADRINSDLRDHRQARIVRTR